MMNQSQNIFFQKLDSQVLRDLVDAPKTWRLHPIMESCQHRNNNVNSATTL